MKIIKTILSRVIIGFLIFSCSTKNNDFGKLVIPDYLLVYENNESYFPHDFFIELDMQCMNDKDYKAVSIKKVNNYLKIINIYNNCFFGHRIEFKISKNLDITDIKYDYSSDLINGSKTKYIVEKVIFFVDKNPFENEFITGYYTLQIREELSVRKLLKSEGWNDTVSYNIFNGKFKVYTEEEKINGLDWVISQNEICMGIKDSLDVYYTPDIFATFSLGNDSLIKILKQFEIDRSETYEVNRNFALLEMVVDEHGNVIPNSVIINGLKSKKLIYEILNCDTLLSNWDSAFYKGKPVKSKVNLRIQIKD